MNRLLRIADTTDGVFPFMPPVLAPLAPEAHALHWSILDLREVTSAERWDLNLPFIEEQVLGSPTGFKLSFEELTAFAARVHQVIDGLFVACERPNQSPLRSDDDLTTLKKADMLVAAFDSSFWLVSAPDDVLGRYPKRFRHLTEELRDTLRLGPRLADLPQARARTVCATTLTRCVGPSRRSLGRRAGGATSA